MPPPLDFFENNASSVLSKISLAALAFFFSNAPSLSSSLPMFKNPPIMAMRWWLNNEFASINPDVPSDYCLTRVEKFANLITTVFSKFSYSFYGSFSFFSSSPLEAYTSSPTLLLMYLFLSSMLDSINCVISWSPLAISSLRTLSILLL